MKLLSDFFNEDNQSGPSKLGLVYGCLFSLAYEVSAAYGLLTKE